MNQPLKMRIAWQPIIAIAMILVTVVTVAGIVQTNRDTYELRKRRDELKRENGGYQYFKRNAVTYSKYKIVRLPNSDRRIFRWQFRRPRNVLTQSVESIGFHPTLSRTSGDESVSSPYHDELLSIYFQLDDHESIVFFHWDGFPLQRQWQIRDPLVVDLLRNHWHELEFEIAGDPQELELDNDQNFTLLRVRAPAHLLSSLPLGSDQDGTFLLFRVGALAAFEREKLAEAARLTP